MSVNLDNVTVSNNNVYLAETAGNSYNAELKLYGGTSNISKLTQYGPLMGGMVNDVGGFLSKWQVNTRYSFNVARVSSLGVGVYRITHNLGHTRYTLQGNVITLANSWNGSNLFIRAITTTYVDVVVIAVNRNNSHWRGFSFVIYGFPGTTTSGYIPSTKNAFAGPFAAEKLACNELFATKCTLESSVDFKYDKHGILGIYQLNGNTTYTILYQSPYISTSFQRFGNGGHYRITHNMGSTNYCVSAVENYSTYGDSCCLVGDYIRTNAFDIHTFVSRDDNRWGDYPVTVTLIGTK